MTLTVLLSFCTSLQSIHLALQYVYIIFSLCFFSIFLTFVTFLFHTMHLHTTLYLMRWLSKSTKTRTKIHASVNVKMLHKS